MTSLQTDIPLRLFRHLFPPAPPAIEMELTVRVVSSVKPIAILGCVAAIVGLQAFLHRDWTAALLLFVFAGLAVARVSALRRLRPHDEKPANLATARRWARHYALGNFASSFVLGMANLYALSFGDQLLTMLTLCALCCYVFAVILRTAVLPRICLPSVSIVLAITVPGLLLFSGESDYLSPRFAFFAQITVIMVLVLSCVQLTAHLYRTTLNQLVAQRDLINFARCDPLTGLGNRLALRERFELLAPGPARPAALLYLDLDRFKPVNDVHGHQVGDALLKEVAVRLGACIRPGDGAFRMGGDEFVVLQSRASKRGDVVTLAQQLLAALSRPYVVDGKTLHVGASIGISLTDAYGAELDDLAAAADAALYDAKRRGRVTFRIAQEAVALKKVA